jgi:transposase
VVLTGSIVLVKTGSQWEWLPQEMGCGSGMTYWRRLKVWQEAGVWRRPLAGTKLATTVAADIV